MQLTIHKNNKGLTLVEVIAGIVVITIILVSFLTILSQTKKTTAASEDIVSATYIAQQELEEIYSISSKIHFNELKQYIEGNKLNANTTISNATELQTTFNDNNQHFLISLHVKKLNPSTLITDGSLNLFSVTIEIYEQSILKNVVESIYQFK